MTGLRQVAQRAEDLDRAVRFYQDTVGLRLIASFDPPGLAFFDLDGVRLLVERGAPSALLYLDSNDIDAWVESLRATGVTIVTEPHMIFRDDDGSFGDPGVEEWMAFFRDSEDNLVGLVERRRTSG